MIAIAPTLEQPESKNTARRHRKRLETVEKLARPEVRGSAFQLLAAARALAEAGYTRNAYPVAQAAFTLILNWCWSIRTGKEPPGDRDARWLVEKLRGDKAIDNEVRKALLDVISRSKPNTASVMALVNAASLVGGIIGELAPDAAKTAREYNEAKRVYSGRAGNQPVDDAPATSAKPAPLTLMDAQELPEVTDEAPPELATVAETLRRCGEPARLTVRFGSAAGKQEPLIKQAQRLLDDGRFVLAGLAARTALVEHLRALCVANACLPGKRPEGTTWRRGYTIGEYTDRLASVGVIGEETACTARQLEVLGEAVCELVLQGGPPVERLVTEAERFIVANPIPVDQATEMRAYKRDWKAGHRARAIAQ